MVVSALHLIELLLRYSFTHHIILSVQVLIYICIGAFYLLDLMHLSSKRKQTLIIYFYLCLSVIIA